ncbi:Spermidine/putrescine ABC transporter, permease protein [Burkholderia singularis]|uniref:Spermidine/putrescine transport system permease protein PotC n=1 Tax=Burkholderia singularis TaxID=1503053 RepID=A0A238H215_9BURK|nr:Spermidine/putrescine ABC transporter, permease protein [Burkholderia singularis]
MKRMPLTAPVTWLVIVFLYLPVVAIVWMSFNAGRSALVWSGWGIDGYLDALRDQTLVSAALTSLVLAGASAAIATPIAIAAALAGWKVSSSARGVLTGSIGMPLVIPEVVLAIGTALMFAMLSIEPGFATVLFAHVVFCLPFAYLPVSARLAKIDRHLLDAAAVLSATPWRVLTQVTLPLAMPGVMAGATLAFVASMNDYVTSYFLAGAGFGTLPMYIFGALKLGLTPKINAISTAIIGISALQIVAIGQGSQEKANRSKAGLT